MFSFLKEQNSRPPLFSAYTAKELWTDPHVAGQMLASHLDPAQDLASRNHTFIERSVRWLSESFHLESGKQVLDLGCGPGLYANGLAELGVSVTGVDFSGNSLTHARSVAESNGLLVAYRQANYLDLELDGTFDLILLIYGDLCALSPVQRRSLLEKIKGWLAPGGRFVFDVFSSVLFDGLEEYARYEVAPEGGFWSAEPYFLFTNRFKYLSEMAYLDRHTIIEADRQREIYNWIQCYTPPSLKTEMEGAGWEVEVTLGNLAGDSWDPNSNDFGAVARTDS
jgi:2-polyprenyl-3-methyl-5-hydroxy-6-metoxy-1,4-benzoquinol methylase